MSYDTDNSREINAAEIDAESTPAERRSRARKVRLLTLDDLDDRTRAAQVVREMRGEILPTLGGETAWRCGRH